jgi:hypothetical protein
MDCASARLHFCCSLLSNDSCGKKLGDTWIHNHKKEVSTWTHAHRVMENDFLTWKQAPKSNVKTKLSLPFKQTCEES